MFDGDVMNPIYCHGEEYKRFTEFVFDLWSIKYDFRIER